LKKFKEMSNNFRSTIHHKTPKNSSVFIMKFTNLNQFLIFILIFKLSPSTCVQISDIDCSNPFKNLIHPYECCYYPILYITNTTAQSCVKNCSTNKNNFCCIFDCAAKSLEILKNNKVSIKNLIKFYESNVKSEWEMSTERWMPVIRHNIAVCDKISNYYSFLKFTI